MSWSKEDNSMNGPVILKKQDNGRLGVTAAKVRKPYPADKVVETKTLTVTETEPGMNDIKVSVPVGRQIVKAVNTVVKDKDKHIFRRGVRVTHKAFEPKK